MDQQEKASQKDKEFEAPTASAEDLDIELEVDRELRGKLGNFNDFLATRYSKRRPGMHPKTFEQIEEFRRQKLSEQGLDLDAPDTDIHDIKSLTQEDWESVKSSSEPLLCFCATLNYRRTIVSNSKFEPSAEDLTALGRLPLVHEASYEILGQIMKRGRFLTEREIFDRNLNEKKPHKSQTTSTDRKIGLDEYVFTHFGRPQWAGHFGGIEIHLKPNKFLEDERSFATLHDYADLQMWHDDVSPQSEIPSQVAYKDEILQGEQFYRTAACLLRDQEKLSSGQRLDVSAFITGETDRRNMLDHITFGTWEVKTKGFEVSDIDSIIFTSIDEFRRFQQEFPDSGIRIKFKLSAKDLSSAIEQIYGEHVDIPTEYLLRNLDKLETSYLGWRQKVEEYFGVEVVITAEETYKLREENFVSPKIDKVSVEVDNSIT